MNLFNRRERIPRIETDKLILRLNYSKNNQYCYFIYLKENGKQIGYCDLRVGHNADLYYYGNIGYRIKEEYRGNGYAYQATLPLLDLARKYQMGYLIVTCSPENAASAKTIEKLGCQYIKTVTVPFWHPLYQNERIKNIYRIDL